MREERETKRSEKEVIRDERWSMCVSSTETDDLLLRRRRSSETHIGWRLAKRREGGRREEEDKKRAKRTERDRGESEPRHGESTEE